MDATSAWCIYGTNCEFFFSPDFHLRSISIEPVVGKIQAGDTMATWPGDLVLDIGRHPAIFAGSKPITLHTLPKALQLLNRLEFGWTIGGGNERDIYIEFVEGSRRLTLKYEVSTIPVDGDKNIVFEIDYFLSSVFILDQSVQGG